MVGGNVKLSIVFLNFNRIRETRFTVGKLRDLVSDRGDVEIIAVDNGSSDGTGEYLESNSDFLTPILLNNNSGIAGYTPGFERARGLYILVLDDDSHPQNESTLDCVISYLDAHPEIGAVACRIVDATGNRIASWHLPVHDEAGPSMSFIGCGFAIRRNLFKQIGWYPEEFFLYQNEVDVAMQVYLHGFQIHYEPRCTIIHRALPSDRPGSRRVYFATRNSLLLIRHYYSWPDREYLMLSRVIIGLVRALQFMEIRAYLRGLWEGMNCSVTNEALPAEIKPIFSPFWKENSLWHQISRNVQKISSRIFFLHSSDSD